MALKVTKVDVWAAQIEDQPGALAAKLDALAKAGANLEFVIARRADASPGKSVVFVTPIKAGKPARQAKANGFSKTPTLHSLRAQGPDRKGQGAKIATALGNAGINLRGLSAAAIGGKFVMHIAVDDAAAANKAIKVLKAM
ncbi:MAG: hypothetical protein WD042_06885 [Phycisphaeraceae bacterium]